MTGVALRPITERWGLTERQAEILQVVVSRFLASGQPIASHEVLEQTQLRVSSATVRAEFVALTERGYLGKPHTQAGRVPTDEALRLYARELIGHPTLSLTEQQRIEASMNKIRNEIELLLEETSQLLHDETQCVGVVVAPREQWGHIETIRLLQADSHGLLVALVFAWGHVESIITPLQVETGKLDIPMLERFLQQELAGNHLSALQPERLERAFALAKSRSLAHRALFEPIQRFVADLATSAGTKVVSTGVLSLATDPAFDHQPRLRTLLRLAQDPTFPPQIFLDMSPAHPGARVRIGRDLGDEEYEGLAIVWAPFGRNDTDGGRVGIFGPSRLPYDRAIPLVEYCAQLLERNLPAPQRLIN